MVTVEDNTEPAPPDIRPSSRTRTSNGLDALGQQRRATPFNHHRALLLFWLALAGVPAVAAQSVPSDPPSVASGQQHNATPILNILKSGAGWLISSATEALGYELHAIPASSSHAKRGEEMNTTHIVEACMIPVLVCLSGIFAGLTLGYFSVDPTQLQVLAISGTPKQQQYARSIMPVRKNSHLLLTTLILGNMIVNEALPVITDGVLGGGILAVVISTALVVIFAEIIPQSICSRNGLAIGATMAPVVRVLMFIFFPLAWPIAKLLEYMLGAHHGIIYRRSELRELIKMHAAGAEGGGDLDVDTVTMAQGALDLAQKTVKDAMTPIDDVFMLPITAKLDYETLGEVVRSGHSRIPVYQMVEVPDIDLTAPQAKGIQKTKLVKKVMGSMLVKSCVLLDPEDATPLATIPLNSIPSVPWNEPLTNMLNVFQTGRSHMAIVSRLSRHVDDSEDVESVMTHAAGGLKHRIMRKMADLSLAHKSSSSGGSDTSSDTDIELGHKKSMFRRKSTASSAPTTSSSPAEHLKETIQQKAREDTEKTKRSIAEAARLNQNEQLVPADAELPSKNLEQFFEGLDGAPLGIITLEDVLEELIGEEIYDEYDTDGGRTEASNFVPREAALAASKAALGREQATQEPNPALGAAESAPAKRGMMPKLPKFNLTKARSQPGRSRADLPQVIPPQRAASPVPTFKDEEQEKGNASNPVETATVPTLESEKPADPAPKITRFAAVEGSQTTPNSSTNLLSEALMIERGRRRLAAGAARPGVARTASSPGFAGPSRPAGAGAAAAAGAGAPVAANRRVTKFKSTPLSQATGPAVAPVVAGPVQLESTPDEGQEGAATPADGAEKPKP